MSNVTSIRAGLVSAATFVALMLLFHGNANAAASCTAPTISALALGSSFEPPALVAGTQISGTITGTCKKDTANTVTITLSNGANFTGGIRAMKCAACAGPTPFFLLQYQLFESGGTVVFPSGGVTVTCSSRVARAARLGRTAFHFVAQILQPVAATSFNDSQIGTYSDTNLKATATPTTAGTTGTSAAASVTATVVQFCTNRHHDEHRIRSVRSGDDRRRY